MRLTQQNPSQNRRAALLLTLTLLLALVAAGIGGCGGGGGGKSDNSGGGPATAAQTRGTLSVVVLLQDPNAPDTRVLPGAAEEVVAQLISEDGSPVATQTLTRSAASNGFSGDTTMIDFGTNRRENGVYVRSDAKRFLTGAYVLRIRAEDTRRSGVAVPREILASATVPIQITETESSTTITLSATVDALQLRSGSETGTAVPPQQTFDVAEGLSTVFATVLDPNGTPTPFSSLAAGSFKFESFAFGSTATASDSVTVMAFAGGDPRDPRDFTIELIKSTYDAGVAKPATVSATYTDGSVQRIASTAINVRPTVALGPTQAASLTGLVVGQTVTIKARLTGANETSLMGLLFEIDGSDDRFKKRDVEQVGMTGNVYEYTATFTVEAGDQEKFILFRIADTDDTQPGVRVNLDVASPTVTLGAAQAASLTGLVVGQTVTIRARLTGATNNSNGPNSPVEPTTPNPGLNFFIDGDANRIANETATRISPNGTANVYDYTGTFTVQASDIVPPPGMPKKVRFRIADTDTFATGVEVTLNVVATGVTVEETPMTPISTANVPALTTRSFTVRVVNALNSEAARVGAITLGANQGILTPEDTTPQPVLGTPNAFTTRFTYTAPNRATPVVPAPVPIRLTFSTPSGAATLDITVPSGVVKGIVR